MPREPSPASGEANLKPWMLDSLFAAAWALFTAWRVRTFWRTWNEPEIACRYSEAKFWCLFVTIGSAVVLPREIPFGDISYAAQAALWAVLVFPASLLVGYWVSQTLDVLSERRSKK